jgi:hypothetical protein
VILLWGSASDGPLATIHEALDKRGAKVFLLDQSRSAETEIDLTVGSGVSGEVRVAGATCDLSAVSGVYVRCHNARIATLGAEHDATLGAHADRLDSLMSAFLDVSRARVINPAEAMATNGSKPYQSAIIRAHSFAVPDTLITTDTRAVEAFVAQHGEVIYKSVSGIRSIVRRLRPEDFNRLEDIVWCPTQFQQYIPGRDFRVHVVGDATFVAEIVSEADDYRYASRDDEGVTIHSSRIPAFLEDRCHAVAASLGLIFAGIDLRLTPQGEWYCFEANPSPAFTYYELATGQPIGQAVAALLDAG